MATTGDNRNPGTSRQPWRTVQYAADHVHAGQVVTVRAGVYPERVTVHVSGNDDKGPIIFQSSPGEQVVLDGASLVVPSGDLAALFEVKGQSDIIVKGFELRGLAAQRADQVPAGLAITGAGKHIRVREIHVHDIRAFAGGPHCTRSGPGTANAFGIAVYGDAPEGALEDVVIENSELDHLQTGCSESLAINGNVAGWAILRNRLHDNNNIGIDAIGGEAVSPRPQNDVARNGLIAGNAVAFITTTQNRSYPAKDPGADGIYIDGAAHVVVEDNVLHDTDIGIEVGSEARDRAANGIVVRRNLVYQSHASGLSLGSYARGLGGTVDTTLEDNFLFDNDTQASGSAEIEVQYGVRGTVFMGNTVAAGKEALLLGGSGVVPTAFRVLDDNVYTVPAFEVPHWTWQGRSLKTLQQWQAASRLDAHSCMADPRGTVFPTALTSTTREASHVHNVVRPGLGE